MKLNDAVNEVLKNAPAFNKIEIIPMLSRGSEHIVIVDGRIVQGYMLTEDGKEIGPGMKIK